MASASAVDNQVHAYAAGVVSEEIVAGRLVHLACIRHLRDLEEGELRGIHFDLDAALEAIGFFSLLNLPDSSQPFILQPWQQFVIGSIFGWKSADGARRFRTAYIEAGKGSGKSPLAAGVGLYGLVMDGERAAEIYAAATTTDQASILFRDAKNLIDASPQLRRRLEVGRWNVAHHPSKSFFRPVSSEHRQLDGKRVHFALIDEIHEHPTSLVVDKLRAGTKGRRQALIFEITNSGFDQTSVCWHHHEYSAKVLGGVLQDDSWFAYICTLDPCAIHEADGKEQPVDGCHDCDDWRNEACWLKANPNLGISIKPQYLREQVREAIGMPSKEGIVKRLNFCLWTQGKSAWLPPTLWSRGAGPIDREALKGRECFGGLDMASKIDLAAFVLDFPDWPEPGHATLLAWFWSCQEYVDMAVREWSIPYHLWEKQGLLTVCDGNCIDPAMIEETVKEAYDVFELKEVAYDPWNAQSSALHLQQHGVKMVEFAQTLKNFNEPAKSFEMLLRQGKLHHGGNGVLNYMASCVTVITDASGNIRPVKPEHGTRKKVDGIVAAVMARGRAILMSAPSVYDTRGVANL